MGHLSGVDTLLRGYPHIWSERGVLKTEFEALSSNKLNQTKLLDCHILLCIITF